MQAAQESLEKMSSENFGRVHPLPCGKRMGLTMPLANGQTFVNSAGTYPARHLIHEKFAGQQFSS
jgi:hypothetical protein